MIFFEFSYSIAFIKTFWYFKTYLVFGFLQIYLKNNNTYFHTNIKRVKNKAFLDLSIDINIKFKNEV